MSEPALACPRCSLPMTPRRAAPRAGAKVIRADVCEKCSGIWLDEYELGEVSAQLGGLPFRVAEIQSTGAPGANIASCPRCATTPVEIALLDIAIDVCPSCRGVWLDGGEYEALGRAAQMEAETTSSYRLAPKAAKAMKQGRFDCPRCEEERPVADGMITPGGLVCGPCFHAHDEAQLLAEASRDHGELTAKMKEGAIRPHQAPSQGAGTAAVLLSLFAAMGPRFCEHCGKRRDDPDCEHHARF